MVHFNIASNKHIKVLQKNSIDESTKRINEVSNNAKTELFENASANEINAFQA